MQQAVMGRRYFFANTDIHSFLLLTSSIQFQCVPHITIEIVITAQHETATLREGDRGDAADDVVMGVHANFLIRPYVEQSTGGVVGASGKGEAVGKELELKNKSSFYFNANALCQYVLTMMMF